MKRTSPPHLFPLFLGLLGAASGQLEGSSACVQVVDGPDPGDGNYGDLLCSFDENDPFNYPQIERTVIFTSDSTVTGYITQGVLEGYEVNYVWYLNFGRERGVATNIEITNDPVGDFAEVYAEVEFAEGADIRMFLEIYGTVRNSSGLSPTSIKIDSKPKFGGGVPKN